MSIQTYTTHKQCLTHAYTPLDLRNTNTLYCRNPDACADQHVTRGQRNHYRVCVFGGCCSMQTHERSEGLQ